MPEQMTVLALAETIKNTQKVNRTLFNFRMLAVNSVSDFLFLFLAVAKSKSQAKSGSPWWVCVCVCGGGGGQSATVSLHQSAKWTLKALTRTARIKEGGKNIESNIITRTGQEETETETVHAMMK